MAAPLVLPAPGLPEQQALDSLDHDVHAALGHYA
jgi:hypothetical protein